jgi:hypothetical protein
VSPSPLIVRTPQKFGKPSRSRARRIYCAAYETGQGDRSDSFSAIADLLIIAGEDFFDLSSVLQFGHGYLVRHRIWFDALTAREVAQRTNARLL